jgi:hypothetical protein
MSPELASALKDWPPILVMAAVFIIVLRYINARDKAQREADATRDKQWQDFFTALHKGEDEKNDKIASALDKLTALLVDHDRDTKQAIVVMHERTRPRPRADKE